MKNFEYIRTRSVNDAVGALGGEWAECAIKAGGTDLIGEMKEELFSPAKVVTIAAVSDLGYIRESGEAIEIGPTVTLSTVAENGIIRNALPALSQAATVVASPQLRNVGTIGGNICQRPRCWYYRDHGVDCFKKGGDNCYAALGRNKYHAIMGGSPCYIVHPSDTAVALTAYDAMITITNDSGEREVAADDFFILPMENVMRENVLTPGDIVTKIAIPKPSANARGKYVKIQEREAWDFAVAAVAVNLVIESGRCTDARIVLGAAAPKPWRSAAAEDALKGGSVTKATAQAAAEAAVADAEPLEENGYKVDLFKNIVREAILDLV